MNMHALHYIALSNSPSQKIASSLTEDKNPKVPTGTMEKWKLPVILPMFRQNLQISPLPNKPLLCIHCQMLNV